MSSAAVMDRIMDDLGGRLEVDLAARRLASLAPDGSTLSRFAAELYGLALEASREHGATVEPILEELDGLVSLGLVFKAGDGSGSRPAAVLFADRALELLDVVPNEDRDDIVGGVSYVFEVETGGWLAPEEAPTADEVDAFHALALDYIDAAPSREVAQSRALWVEGLLAIRGVEHAGDLGADGLADVVELLRKAVGR